MPQGSENGKTDHESGEALVEQLLARMTVEEKAGQMSQLPLPAGDTPEDALEAVRAGKVGSFLNAQSVDQRNHLQGVAVKESRLGIPLLFGRDVIHGYKTVFPIPLGQSASFDPALVQQAAAVAAREAREGGVDWVFAPMVDIARDPRWGRIAEGCGEDPYLTACMGAAMVRGFQGSGPRAPGSVVACVKHFVGYGAVEAGREYNTTWIPEPLLRELYLVPFKACVDAGVLTLMSAFNDLNGIPVTGNAAMLRGVLKEEWGFEGFVVSDWASVVEMVTHGLVGDEAGAAVLSLRAGVDMEMSSGAYLANLPRLLSQGKVSIETVDDAVRRVLRVKHRVGLFEAPYARLPAQPTTFSAAHRATAQELARRSLVLLKNDGGVLPLRPGTRSIAVVGPLADDGANQLGCWSFDGDPSAVTTPLAALRERCRGSTEIRFAKGVDDCRSDERGGFEAAVEAARQSDVVIAFVGEGANLTGEAHSRAFLHPPGVQEELIEALWQTGRPLVVVFLAGRPLTIGRTCQAAHAVLWAWHPGTMGGPAIVDVLFGDEPPSGKLPVSFPRTVGQVPIYYNAKNTGRPTKGRPRGTPAGTPLDPIEFDSSYLDVDATPEFPFGFGLSYTVFEYSELRLPERTKGSAAVPVSFRVTNRGDSAGVEVAQLYVRDRVASVTRPVRELKRFERVPLGPGESKVVEIALGPEDLSFVGPDMKTTREPGVFDVFVGGDSRASLSATFELESV